MILLLILGEEIQWEFFHYTIVATIKMVRYVTIISFTEFLPTVVEIIDKPFVRLGKKRLVNLLFHGNNFFCAIFKNLMI